MPTTPNEFTLKGRLQIILEGCDGAIELGEIEVPIQLDFGKKPPKPGAVYRGGPDIMPCSSDVSPDTVES